MERPWSQVKVEAIHLEYGALKHKGLRLPYDEYQKLNNLTFTRYSGLEAAEDRTSLTLQSTGT